MARSIKDRAPHIKIGEHQAKFRALIKEDINVIGS